MAFTYDDPMGGFPCRNCHDATDGTCAYDLCTTCCSDVDANEGDPPCPECMQAIGEQAEGEALDAAIDAERCA